MIRAPTVGVIGFFFAHSKANERTTHIALACILAGAIGNLHDRIAFGAVRARVLFAAAQVSDR